jgi:hypothetical protein
MLSAKLDMGFLPSQPQASLARRLARVILTEWAVLRIISFVHEDVTVRAKIFIFRNPWSADLEKSHGCLHFHTFIRDLHGYRADTCVIPHDA